MSKTDILKELASLDAQELREVRERIAAMERAGSASSAFELNYDRDALFRLMVEHSSDVIAILDESTRVQFINPAIEKVAGYSPDELVGQFAFTHVHADDLERIRNRFASIMVDNGLTALGEARFQHKNGKWLHFEASVISLPSAQGARGLLVNIRDITEKKEVGARLADQASAFHALFTGMLDGFSYHEIIVDENNEPIDYRFLAVNPAFEKATGLKASQLIGRRVLEVLPETESYWIKFFGKVAQTGEPALLQQYSKVFDKHFEVLAYQPRPGQFACTFHDITMRIRAEHALAASEQNLRTILEVSPVGIAWSNAQGQIEFWNRKALEMFGYAHAEIDTIQKWYERAYPDPEYRRQVIEQWDALIAQAVKSDGQIPLREYDVTCANGKVLCVEISGAILGEAAMAVLNDVTGRRELERRLLHTHKMDAIGQLAGGVAHDFNNQLMSVLGFTEMLLSNLKEERLCRYAENIMTASQRASDLTKQLLAFARKGKYLSTAVDVHAIIQEVVTLLTHSIDKRIEIIQQWDAAPATILGDPTQIQNALLNLAINARDAMPEGGNLRFATRVVDFADGAPKLELAPGRYIQIDVADSGMGMSPDIQSHLFEPFFTTKPPGKGTGLGLAAVYGTIKNHGGAVSVKSEVGVGTTFTLYLPPHDATVGGKVAAASDRTPVRGNARILIVDDEELVCELVTEMLSELGYAVESCSDGCAALDRFKQKWAAIDLVILDMVMPRISGRDLFLAMRKINPALKVMFSSGFSIDLETRNMLKDGAVEFVQKPFMLEELSTKVAAVLKV